MEEDKKGTLEERMLFYRGRNEQSIPKNSYVICMLDGRTFSSLIKNRYKKPFDDNFINLMNDTAAYVCSQVQGAKFAYVQSDEISIFMSDADSPKSTLFYDGRLVKLLSVIPGLATSYFNRHVFDDKLAIENLSVSDIRQIITQEPLYQFDGKIWNVPTLNDVFAWFHFRQIDCIRNSKNQSAQAYISHNELKKKHTDEQIAMLKERYSIDWNTDFDDGKKYGRFIYKEIEHHTREFKGEAIPYDRSVWKPHYGKDLTVAENRDWFWKTLIDSCKFPEKSVRSEIDNMISDAKKSVDNAGEILDIVTVQSEEMKKELNDAQRMWMSGLKSNIERVSRDFNLWKPKEDNK